MGKSDGHRIQQSIEWIASEAVAPCSFGSSKTAVVSAFGGWRHEKGRHFVEPRDEHRATVNTLMPIPLFKNDTLSIEDRVG